MTVETLFDLLVDCRSCLVNGWPAALELPKKVFQEIGDAEHFASLHWNDYKSGVHHEVRLFKGSVSSVEIAKSGYAVVVKTEAIAGDLLIEFLYSAPCNAVLSKLHKLKVLQHASFFQHSSYPFSTN